MNPWKREQCCPQDMGGSHYHCARCNKVSSMQGHYMGGHLRSGRFERADWHFCCPDDCQLETEPEVVAAKKKYLEDLAAAARVSALETAREWEA